PAQDLSPDIITIMIKRPSAAWDRYYWGAMNTNPADPNPPVLDPAGLTSPAPAHLPPHEPPYFPTGASNGAPTGTAVYTNFGYGMIPRTLTGRGTGDPPLPGAHNSPGKGPCFPGAGRGLAPARRGKPGGGPPDRPGRRPRRGRAGLPPELAPPAVDPPGPAV